MQQEFAIWDSVLGTDAGISIREVALHMHQVSLGAHSQAGSYDVHTQAEKHFLGMLELRNEQEIFNMAPALRILAETYDTIVAELNRLGVGLWRRETMSIRCSKPSTGNDTIALHSDTRDRPHTNRKLTTIYYLNPDWDAGVHGGSLQLYRPNRSDAVIQPSFDRLVLFWSDAPHRVLPSKQLRCTVNQWFGTLDGL